METKVVMPHLADADRDCSFERGGNLFRYRAAAIIIEDGCVLMAGNDSVDYCYSVGGGVHLGESAEDAVRREVFEETGVDYEIDRLVFVHENFFAADGYFKGLDCHEIAFYYLMKPKGRREIVGNSENPAEREVMRWIPVAELKENKAYPTFYVERLSDLPQSVEHILTREP